MEHIHMQLAFLTMSIIYLLSSILNKKFKIPLPHSLIILSYLTYQLFPEFLDINASQHFDSIIFFLIPIILMYDAMHLKWTDIKTYKYSISYLAIFSVGVSILLGTLLYKFEIFGVGMSIGMYVALFSINMATDAISVNNIFSQFKSIPHNIKVLVEGESLGNDATAMIAFYFIGLPWIINNSFDLTTIPWIMFKVYGLSTIIGITVGIIGYQLIKEFNLVKEELIVILGVSYLSFTLGEIAHVSGIFALIVSIILVTTLINKSISEENKNILIKPSDKKDLFRFLKKEVSTKTKQNEINNTLDIFSTFAVILVFVVMANTINIDNLIFYWKEIFVMFFATTFIRMIVMAKFLYVGKKTKAIDYVGFNGWVILTLAGIKGSLSIIMLHALPKDFEFYTMFESITIGVIILSTFIYGFSLLFYMLIKEKRDI